MRSTRKDTDVLQSSRDLISSSAKCLDELITSLFEDRKGLQSPTSSKDLYNDIHIALRSLCTCSRPGPGHWKDVDSRMHKIIRTKLKLLVFLQKILSGVYIQCQSLSNESRSQVFKPPTSQDELLISDSELQTLFTQGYEDVILIHTHYSRLNHILSGAEQNTALHDDSPKGNKSIPKSDRTSIHKNLFIALICAQVILLCSGSAIHNKVFTELCNRYYYSTQSILGDE
uniref:Uncharacterized protein n=1 Tax=Knipowitschia caucasica TaxID=637954 RepID=A0AAV2KV70_KNICA